MDLTQREKTTLQMLIDGASNDDIARAVGLTPGTNRVYLCNLYKKLGVRTRTQAAMAYLQWKKQDIKASRDEAEKFLRSRYQAGVGVFLSHIAQAKSVEERDHWVAELTRHHNEAVHEARKRMGL